MAGTQDPKKNEQVTNSTPAQTEEVKSTEVKATETTPATLNPTKEEIDAHNADEKAIGVNPSDVEGETGTFPKNNPVGGHIDLNVGKNAKAIAEETLAKAAKAAAKVDLDKIAASESVTLEYVGIGGSITLGRYRFDNNTGPIEVDGETAALLIPKGKFLVK